jgi:hypothetical protein
LSARRRPPTVAAPWNRPTSLAANRQSRPSRSPRSCSWASASLLTLGDGGAGSARSAGPPNARGMRGHDIYRRVCQACHNGIRSSTAPADRPRVPAIAARASNCCRRVCCATSIPRATSRSATRET